MGLVGKRRRTFKRKSAWFLLMIVSVLSRGSVKDRESSSASCAASTPVKTGSQSSVHCYFSSPLRKHDGFSVELHRDIETDDSSPGAKSHISSVMDCYMGKETSCTPSEGYNISWENNPGLTVRLDIANATTQHTGRYVCKKTSIPLGSHKGCMLNVKEKRNGKQRTSCKTTGSVVEGQVSTVTCRLAENPRPHRHYFNVLRYDYDKANPMPELVLECHWPPAKSQPSCQTADGYTLSSREVSHVIHLIISNTSKSHGGRYVCEDALSLPDNMNDCELTVKGKSVSCSAPATYEDEHAVVTCHFNSDLKRTNYAFYVLFGNSTVASCGWQETPSRELSCRADYGYSVKMATRTDVAVHIASPKPQHAGTYRCSPFDQQDHITHSCELIVVGKTSGHNSGNEPGKRHGFWRILMIICSLWWLCCSQSLFPGSQS